MPSAGRCFGVGLQTDYTLDQISAQFGLTRERIRQMESRVLRKLRKPELATRLDDWPRAPCKRRRNSSD
uniref:sigma factor-like helix-turn-helix DNA-binding protein n=1 Tax=Cupriavidus necator TaxID=106590 RepID=UPI003F493272